MLLLSLQVTPFGKKHEAGEKKLEFAAGNSDHLTMLNAYNVSWVLKVLANVTSSRVLSVLIM